MTKLAQWKEWYVTVPRTRKVWVILVLQVLFLLYLLGGYYYVKWAGDEIRIKTAPVDPTDLLYGDYVILNYEISRLKNSNQLFVQDSSNEAIYVILEQKGEYYEEVAISREKPNNLSDGQKVLKGRVEYAYADELLVHYGLERYYVEENTGLAIERIRGDVTVVLKVLPSGKAIIDRLEHQGKEL
jgi:uncharacterized membrane-anchored protein